jgi:hypothetical protein
MIQVVVTADQAKLISEAHGSVEVVDENGKRLGYFARPFSDDEILLAKQRLASDEPRYTTAEVLEHLRKLEQKG